MFSLNLHTSSVCFVSSLCYLPYLVQYKCYVHSCYPVSLEIHDRSKSLDMFCTCNFSCPCLVKSQMWNLIMQRDNYSILLYSLADTQATSGFVLSELMLPWIFLDIFPCAYVWAYLGCVSVGRSAESQDVYISDFTDICKMVLQITCTSLHSA